MFPIHAFIKRMSERNNRYWLETEASKITNSIFPHETRVSRFEIFAESKIFCNKPTQMFCITYYTTQNPDLSIKFKGGLVCTLVNVIPFNYPKMDNSLLNSLLLSLVLW